MSRIHNRINLCNYALLLLTLFINFDQFKTPQVFTDNENTDSNYIILP